MLRKKCTLVILALIAIFGSQANAGQGMSGMLVHPDNNDALGPWRDFENSYGQLFAKGAEPEQAGTTRDFIRLIMQQIPSYTLNNGIAKQDLDTRKGAAKLISLMNDIPSINKNNKGECKLQELTQRIVFETIFEQNVHIQTFLEHYNKLYYGFCINIIDKEILGEIAKLKLTLPDKFEEMQKSQAQASTDLQNGHKYSQIARGLTLYLKSNRHNIDRSGDKPAAHLQRVNQLIASEISAQFKCEYLDVFDSLLPKYKLVSSFKSQLSDDSRKWIDIIELCDTVGRLSDQLVLVDLYENEAARLYKIIFAAANDPEFQHHNPENTEEDLRLIIDVLNAKKRLYRQDHRAIISTLDEVKFTLGKTSEFCTLINVQKLQQLLGQYAQVPNISNYLMLKAKTVTKKCKDKVHAEIVAKSEALHPDDVKKLTSLRLRITDATDSQLKKSLHNRIPVESFVEGTMAFLISEIYQKEDGFDIIAKYLAPKTPEESQKMREGAFMILGEICDEVENNFAKVHELFVEFDKFGSESTNFDEDDRDWMANVNICVMIKF